MYIFSVLKYIFKVNNIGTIIFFLLNAAMIVGLFSGGDPERMAYIGIIYLISVVIALSPVGEWFLSLIAGARKMRRIDMKNRILPSVQHVYRKAKTDTPSLPDNIILKVMYDPNPNAFAVGRKTICVTEGLFDLPDEMIEGIFAHEFGHLALHHTDIQLLIGGGNFIVTTFILILQAISAAMTGIATVGTLRSKSCASGCLFSFVGIICAGFVWLWTKFCMLFLMWSSRANEYEADKYAFKIGYGYELAQALDTIGTGVPQNTLLKALYSTHPETNDRIGKLQEMGVPYSRY